MVGYKNMLTLLKWRKKNNKTSPGVTSRSVTPLVDTPSSVTSSEYSQHGERNDDDSIASSEQSISSDSVTQKISTKLKITKLKPSKWGINKKPSRPMTTIPSDKSLVVTNLARANSNESLCTTTTTTSTDNIITDDEIPKSSHHHHHHRHHHHIPRRRRRRMSTNSQINHYYQTAKSFFEEGKIIEAKKYFQLSHGKLDAIMRKQKKDNDEERQKQQTLIRVNIADCAAALGDYAEAQMMYERELRHIRSSEGLESVNVAMVLTKQGNAYMKAGRWFFASECFEELYRMREEKKKNRAASSLLLCDDHECVVNILKPLAMTSEKAMNEAKSVNKKILFFNKIETYLKPFLSENINETNNCKDLYKEKDHLQLIFIRASRHMGDQYCDANKIELALSIYLEAVGLDDHYGYEMACNNTMSKSKRMELGKICFRLGTLYEKKKENEKARYYFKKSLTIQKESGSTNDNNPRATFHTLYRLGLLYFDNDDNNGDDDSKALTIMETAVSLYDTSFHDYGISKTNDEESYYYGILLNSIAIIYARNDRFDDASRILKKRIAHLTKRDFVDVADFVETYHRAGCALFEEGLYDDAMRCHLRVLSLRRQIQKEKKAAAEEEDDDDDADHYHSVYDDDGKMIKRGRRQQRRGEEENAIALTLRLLGACYVRLNMYEEASKCYSEVLDSSSTTTSLEKAQLLFEMGLVKWKQEAMDEAMTLFQEALVCDSSYGATTTPSPVDCLMDDCGDENRVVCEEGDVMKCAILNNLGNLCTEQGDRAHALKYYDEAYTISRDVPSAREHSLGVIYNRGLLHYITGCYEDAEKCYEEFLSLWKERAITTTGGYCCNQDDNDLATKVINDIGNIAFIRGAYNKAAGYYEDSLALKEKYWGRNSIRVVGVLRNLGTVYLCMKDYNKALEYYERSLSIYNPKKDEYITEIAEIQHKIGNVLSFKKEYSKARSRYEYSLEMKKNIVGNKNIDTEMILTQHSIALMLCKERKIHEGKLLLEDCYERAEKMTKSDERYTQIGKLLLDLSSVSLALGNIDQAKKFYHLGLERMKEMKYELHENHTYSLQASSIIRRVKKKEKVMNRKFNIKFW